MTGCFTFIVKKTKLVISMCTPKPIHLIGVEELSKLVLDLGLTEVVLKKVN